MISSLDQPRRLDIGLSWRAIFAGLIAGLVAQFVLTLLGVAIGLSALDVTGQNRNVGGVGLGAGIYAILVPIVAWFVGAYVAAYCSGVLDKGIGVIHGVTAWGAGLLFVVYLLSTGVTGLVSSVFGVAGQSAQALGQSGLVNRQDVQELQGAQQRAQQQLGQLGAQDAQKAADTAATGAWASFFAAILSLGAAALGGAVGAGAIEKRLQHPSGPARGRVGDRAGVTERRDDYPQSPIITPPRTT